MVPVDPRSPVSRLSSARRRPAPARLYLVPRGAREVRSRFDPRLHFVGTIGASRRARAFTVPPIEPGPYALATWCRGCLARAQAVAVQPRPLLRVRASPGGCNPTRPNGDAPPETPRATWTYHGNGDLAVLLPSNAAALTTNALGGYKMLWVARPGLSGLFRVSYRRPEPSSPWIHADTVTGTLSGYAGPSWASRMSFEPGCWQITARLFDVTLSFVAEVVRGSG